MDNTNSIKIIINSESSKRSYLGKYDIYIITTINVKYDNFIYLPFLYQSLLERDNILKICNSEEEEFCVYLYSTIHKHMIKYFNLMNQY